MNTWCYKTAEAQAIQFKCAVILLKQYNSENKYFSVSLTVISSLGKQPKMIIKYFYIL